MTFHFRLPLFLRRFIDSRTCRASESSNGREPDGQVAKRRRILPVDGLSALPDDMLIEILSLLDTKEAVATAILSSRWKNLFRYVCTIRLKDSLIPGESNHGRLLNFTMFGIRQILLRNLVQIKNFCLWCDTDFGDCAIQTMIRAAIWSGVKEMEINVNFEAVPGVLPAEMFNSKLVILKLRGAAFLGEPDLFCLPNLESLHLEETYLDSHIRDSFFGSFPKIQELFLFGLFGPGTSILYLYLPFLKRFSMEVGDGNPGCEIFINTPNLQHFRYQGPYKKFHALEKFNALVRAELDFTSAVENNDGISEFAMKLCGVESIYLSWYAMQVAYSSSNFLRHMVFENLTKLEVGSLHGLWALLYFLEAAPRLKFLIIHSSGGYHLITNEEHCDLPEFPPLCFNGSLKVIEIKNFHGNKEWEVRLVKYFIQKGRAMELKIGTWNQEFAGNVTRKNILDLLRKSSKCSVVFEDRST